MRSPGSVLWPKLRVLQIYGANTGVGKTIFSSILCRAFRNRLPKVNYLKPVSTGPQNEADDAHISKFDRKITSRTLFQFQEPVSPHIAVKLASKSVADSQLQAAIYDELESYATDGEGIAIVETAGGILSPAPSGIPQADVYRPLRLPTILIGDSRLGGIGSTISAWESLHVRGYDVQSIGLFEESRYQNAQYLKDYFQERGVQTFAITPPPDQLASLEDDKKSMQKYYDSVVSEEPISNFVNEVLQKHDDRIANLQSMPERAVQAIWHPFMQHRERSKDTLVVMDSAYDDFFQTYTTKQEVSTPSTNTPMLKSAFDGSASWWTQGLGHGNPKLALTAAHAAGRYGHVMFASAVHEPALDLAETLIKRMGNARLSKVFYTDNGSTGMEVAVKMALRAAAKRYDWQPEDNVEILGLTGSYHGDTIGTMDCSEPSIYNKKVTWYKGRGYWLDFPQIQMRNGQWTVHVPEHLQRNLGATKQFDGLEAIFDLQSRKTDYEQYRAYLDGELQRLAKEGHKFGALVMEPVILGAGGMMFADPLFQRCLVEAARGVQNSLDDEQNSDLNWQGMPVIFDEVFTGLYRLGQFSAAKFLGVNPDIVVNAKLLTGGLLPLCTTTASEAIFESFLSDDKSDALLHGHSYTAHAVGCAVANKSLDTMLELSTSQQWRGYQQDWDGVWSMWSKDLVHQISQMENVDYVFAIGSVFAMSLKDPAGSGYASTAAVGLRDQLLAIDSVEDPTIHSRVLGNTLYLMAAMTSKEETLRSVEKVVLKVLSY